MIITPGELIEFAEKIESKLNNSLQVDQHINNCLNNTVEEMKGEIAIKDELLEKAKSIIDLISNMKGKKIEEFIKENELDKLSKQINEAIELPF